MCLRSTTERLESWASAKRSGTALAILTFSPVMRDPTSATLTLGTTDPTDATDGIMVTITAKLDDHPQVAPATNTFKIVIIC